MKNFHAINRLEKVADGAASAGTAINTSSIDATGYDAVAFFLRLATFHASNSVKLQSSADDSTWKDLDGVSGNTTANGKVLVIDCHRPTGGPYYRAVVTRSGANTLTGDAYGVAYNGHDVPVTQGSGTEAVFFNAPEEVSS